MNTMNTYQLIIKGGEISWKAVCSWYNQITCDFPDFVLPSKIRLSRFKDLIVNGEKFTENWHDWEKDMYFLSLQMPTIHFVLKSRGGHSLDQWNAHFLGGKCAFLRGKLVFPEFDCSKLEDLFISKFISKEIESFSKDCMNKMLKLKELRDSALAKLTDEEKAVLGLDVEKKVEQHT